MQCRPPDRPRARRPAGPLAGSVTDDDRLQPAKQYWLIKRASNKNSIKENMYNVGMSDLQFTTVNCK